MNNEIKKAIDNIVWFIPNRKLRDSIRFLLSNLTYNDNKIKDNNIKDNNKVLCPICGWSGKEFLPFGVITRKNAQCPNCESLERHRLYYIYLLNKIDTNKNIKVCHFAPEKSISQLFQMFKNIEYISCDIRPEAAMQVQDITKTTFEDNTFDIIFCSRVLEHIEDDKKAMRELFRILKPNGFAILQVPLYQEHNGIKLETTYEDFSITSPEGRTIAFGQSDHVRKYEKNDYVKRLKDSGFNVVEDNFSLTLTDAVKNKYAIKDEIIFICNNRAEQSRAEQSRAEQSRAEQSRAEQSSNV